ncbi:non-ribosomal peptide synthetase [Streptomyces sp. rh34]|uniref:non-ribosomal peptide synthetase n=1 Tax=Streptomyces sp. rh34 TaxID=2034272 RepID=UPI000BEF6B9C|nr:non-ribosomal peptide synthetase [Streptomyces sp. rh34]
MNTETGAPGDGPRPLTELFAASVASHPGRTAVSDDTGHKLSYADLDRASARLARRLIAEGVRPEDRVGVHRERDLDLVVAVLGVLRAGAAYVTVDLRYPRARRELMLRAADTRLVLTDADGGPPLDDDRATLGWTHREAAPLDRAVPPTDPVAALPTVRPQDAACVLFTSGSTGTPKGVVLEHRNLTHFAANPALVPLSATDRVAQVSNVSFDAFHFELWCSLAAGAEIVMMPSLPDLVRVDVGRELRRRRVTAMLTPTMAFNHLAAEDPDVFAGLRVLHTGGDVVRPSACRAVLETSFTGRLSNLYGPTEATTAATGHEITEAPADGGSVPIGRPLTGVTVQVLDERLAPTPTGSVGELYVGGAGVTRGYLRDPARTAERFLPDPVGPPGSVVYATGDLVVQHPDGLLEYVGRSDAQVKVRGYRVELREVERSLLAHPEVLDVAVLSRGDDHDRTLVAFVVPKGRPALAELRRYAQDVLPDYQVPAEFVRVADVPVTGHGKRDDAALLARLAERDLKRGDFVAPRTDSEQYLIQVWSEMLGIERVSVTDDFFSLGGHSMLAFRMSRRITRDRASQVSVLDILNNTMLAELAGALDRAATTGGAA